MAATDIPFNVTLLKVTPQMTSMMRPVRVLDFFETASGDFHPDGLFSVPIFGRVGDEMRDRRFSYIDLKMNVFHPVIFERICQLKTLYRSIMAGERYAKWDTQLKDFVPADELDGETGYSFFMRHWKDIHFIRNESDIRNQRIDLIERYKEAAVTSKVLVLPAGMRDIEIDYTERMTVGDHNDSYRKLLSLSRSVGEYEDPDSIKALDLPRWMMQQAFNELYQGIIDILIGKKGFLQNKWASRRIFDSTRNVITAMDHSVEDLGSPYGVRFTDTIVGLWQMSRNVLPKTIHYLRTSYLERIFGYGDLQSRLVNMDTLSSDIVVLESTDYDRWTTVEGLEKIVVSYKDVTIRDRPIVINGKDRVPYYLALVYRGPDPTGRKVFRVFSDINELPEGWDRKYVHPITLIELIYLSGYRYWNDFAGFVTRYPVTGTESIYPTTIYLKTTMRGERRFELNEQWEVDDDSMPALEYPTFGNPTTYQDSAVIPSPRLSGLGADLI